MTTRSRKSEQKVYHIQVLKHGIRIKTQGDIVTAYNGYYDRQEIITALDSKEI